MHILVIALVAAVISFLLDKGRTIRGIKRGLTQFLKLLPTLLSILIIVSVVMYFVSEEFIVKYLGNEAGLLAYFFAALTGSVSILPGFVSYPLAAVLVKSGVGMSVISVFITTLKMVGFITIPLEAKFFGFKVAVLRNVLSLFGALLVGGIMALIYLYI